jgi:hypothetical protein
MSVQEVMTKKSQIMQCQFFREYCLQFGFYLLIERGGIFF